MNPAETTVLFGAECIGFHEYLKLLGLLSPFPLTTKKTSVALTFAIVTYGKTLVAIGSQPADGWTDG